MTLHERALVHFLGVKPASAQALDYLRTGRPAFAAPQGRRSDKPDQFHRTTLQGLEMRGWAKAHRMRGGTRHWVMTDDGHRATDAAVLAWKRQREQA